MQLFSRINLRIDGAKTVSLTDNKIHALGVLEIMSLQVKASNFSYLGFAFLLIFSLALSFNELVFAEGKKTAGKSKSTMKPKEETGAKPSESQMLPPLAPTLARPITPSAETELPAPSPSPEGEMPPSAPPITKRDEPEPNRGSGNLFSLQAQQFQMNTQEQAPRLQPLDARFGQAGSAMNLGARQNQLGTGVENEGGKQRTLTQVDLQKLAAHDVVLLIDRSGSMSAMDCPTMNLGHNLGMIPSLLGIPLMSTSRWNWCLQQTSDLARQTASIYDRGITVVLFSTGFMTFPNVTMDRLPSIFSQNYPDGGTNLAQPLALQIGEYFRRREMMQGRVKPLIVGIITDGCPNNRQAVRDAIIDATHLMRNQQEVTIIFFMIGGMDFMGEHFVHGLCSNLVSEGAAFPIVKEVSFAELQQIGLAKAVAQNLQ